MSTQIPRQTYVTQSVQTYVRDALVAAGAPMDQIDLRESFDQSQYGEEPLTKDVVAPGFNFDQGGTPIEMGSNLRQYRHLIEIFVLATSAKRGEWLAYVIRDALEEEGWVPLLDILAPGTPRIDVLLVDPVRVERQVTVEPDPWQEFAWLVQVPVIDEHTPGG